MTRRREIPTRRLGRTNLQVTELSLGCYMFTGEFGVSQAEAGAILDYAFRAGINYADTAQMYGFGEGEELVGRALLRHKRQKIYVSSKVGWLDRSVVRNLGEAAYRNEDALRRTIEHSFWLLRRDPLDIFMIHEPNLENWWGLDRKTGDAVVTRVLEDYKRQGRIGAIGLGGWDCEHTADLIETGRFDVALIAGGYTLIHQPVRERVLAAAKKHDVGLIMGGTMLQGLLAVKQRERMETLLREKKFEGWLNERSIRRLLAIYDLSDEVGLPLPELAIRYVLSDPAVHTQIPGAQQLAHIQANVAAAAKGPLPPDVIKRIDEIAKL